jgi:hypothetical protein
MTMGVSGHHHQLAGASQACTDLLGSLCFARTTTRSMKVVGMISRVSRRSKRTVVLGVCFLVSMLLMKLCTYPALSPSSN